MLIKWYPSALEDLQNQVDYIFKDNPNVAIKLQRVIWNSVNNLTNNPFSGKNGRVLGTRELILPRYPYVIVCQIRGDRVEIIKILHTSRRYP